MDSTLDLKSNTSRIATFDLARGLAILFMMLIHVLDFYGQADVRSSLFGSVVSFLGSPPAAPVFMFIMGIFIVFSTRLDVATGLRRAAWLFVIGYVLNLLRGSIPLWLSLQLGLVSYAELEAGGVSPLSEFLIVDILQFAGLAFAICVFLKHYFPQPKYWLATGVIVVFLSPLLWDISSGWIVLDEVLKLLWGNKYQGSMFPLFPWLAYPLFGMAFGFWFKRTNSPKRFFINTLWLGLALLLVGTLLTLSNMDFHYPYFLRSGPGATIWISGFVLLWLGICRFVVENIALNRVVELLFFWSKHVTAIYILQWIIIGWGLMAVGVQQLSFINTLLAMFVVILLSDLSLRGWLRVRKSSNA
ncbi:heparan-alpha-glucosaminide N-acetyltransferase domain-containing protein [Methylophaga sp.]|uniref:heparan-alpha-glucosaminide N-acetyltransferase domain-containing protein n=1 Tax=Methylophaga sp. TaxID=2024840 RepID=UPI002720046C|nr:heparan-alpha-glucosaminide N-acetyltransferase domain-containing protein [Methylophaga sp.]MDO8827564.1 heparan-alpha-glucosaminide N-acetyltransferase domain-containing protein [Methylophaga sp.]